MEPKTIQSHERGHVTSTDIMFGIPIQGNEVTLGKIFCQNRLMNLCLLLQKEFDTYAEQTQGHIRACTKKNASI